MSSGRQRDKHSSLNKANEFLQRDNERVIETKLLPDAYFCEHLVQQKQYFRFIA